MKYNHHNLVCSSLYRLSLILFLTLTLSLTCQADTESEAVAKAQLMVDNVIRTIGDVPNGPELDCDLPKVFNYYKMQPGFLVTSPTELCFVVNSYADHFVSRIENFWTFKDKFGFVTWPISNIEQYNAMFDARPILAKLTLPKFNLLYLSGIPVSPQKVVWSHEAGHAALQEMLEDHFFIKAKETLVKRITNQILQNEDEGKLFAIQKRLSEIHKIWETLSSDEKIVISREEKMLGFKEMVLKNLLNGKDAMTNPIFLSFHEFFADLFAAEIYKNLNIVGEAFDELGLKTNSSDFRRFNPTTVVSNKDWNELEPHILFTPARHYFGKNIASKVRDPKFFMQELAKYFIQLLEKPAAINFQSYEPIIKDVEKSETPESVAKAIVTRQRTMILFSNLSESDIKSLCEYDFITCKTEILSQLKLGQNGIFLTNVNPTTANQNLIDAMESIVKKNP